MLCDATPKQKISALVRTEKLASLAELTDELNELLKPAALDCRLHDKIDELTGLLMDNVQKVVQPRQARPLHCQDMLLHSRDGSGGQRSADINALLYESLNLTAPVRENWPSISRIRSSAGGPWTGSLVAFLAARF